VLYILEVRSIDNIVIKSFILRVALASPMRSGEAEKRFGFTPQRGVRSTRLLWPAKQPATRMASPNQIKLLPTPRSGAKRSQRSQIKPLHEVEGEAKGQSQRAKSKGEAIHPQSGEAEKQFDLACYAGQRSHPSAPRRSDLIWRSQRSQSTPFLRKAEV
jgi:hypothetical protein